MPLVRRELEHDLSHEDGREQPEDDHRRQHGRQRSQHACQRGGDQPQDHVGIDEAGGVASWIVASPAMQSAVPAAAIQPISS